MGLDNTDASAYSGEGIRKGGESVCVGLLGPRLRTFSNVQTFAAFNIKPKQCCALRLSSPSLQKHRSYPWPLFVVR